MVKNEWTLKSEMLLFLQFSPIFVEKIGVFRKNRCASCVKIANFFIICFVDLKNHSICPENRWKTYLLLSSIHKLDEGCEGGLAFGEQHLQLIVDASKKAIFCALVS
jgi:hypothetical protein